GHRELIAPTSCGPPFPALVPDLWVGRGGLRAAIRRERVLRPGDGSGSAGLCGGSGAERRDERRKRLAPDGRARCAREWVGGLLRSSGAAAGRVVNDQSGRNRCS